MRKILLLFAALLSCPTLTHGVVISPEEALRRMRVEEGDRFPTRSTRSPELLFTSKLASGEAGVYIFSNPDTHGYWILSADNAAAPVLGYADNTMFSQDNIPPQLEWWIEEYGRQIAYARENGISTFSNPTRADLKPVAPLIQTKWDQTAPFNNMCPKIKGRNALTGCVATAMAQVMKFWNYPETGTGRGVIVLPGSTDKDEMSFSERKFDWDNMLDWYGSGSDYTEAQGNAVAYLMKACGYSCDMQYSTTSSGALSFNAASALINHFKYNSNIQFWDRNYFSSKEWEEMVYNEVAEGRPVLYSGVSSSGGHEFICDGYSSDGYFHFNWGWSGMSDGYFLLDALNPSNLGSGGGKGGGFNYNQDIIVGIQPTTTATPIPRLMQMGNLHIIAKFNTVSLKLTYGDRDGFWANMGILPINVDIGVKIEPVDGTAGTIRYIKFGSGNIAAPKTESNGDGSYSVHYSGFSNGDITMPSDLANGKYKLTVCTKGKDSADSSYTPVLCGSDGYNYAYVKKSGNTYTVENLAVPELKITAADAVSELYYNLAVKMSISVTNDSEKELTGSYYPCLQSGNKTLMTASGVTLSVLPHETVTREFTTVFELEEGIKAPTTDQKYTLGFYDPETDEVYDWTSEVTMKVSAPAPVFSISDFEMPGLSYKDVNLNNEQNTPTKMFIVTDTEEMEFVCKINVEKGYLGIPFYLAILPNGGEDLIHSSAFDEVPTASAGQSVTLSQTIDFEAGEAGNRYMVWICTANGNTLIPCDNFVPIGFIIANSGIDDTLSINDRFSITFDRANNTVSADSPSGIASIAVISLDGKQELLNISITGNSAIASLPYLSSGIYIIKAVDNEGNITTIKIAK